MTEKWRCSLAWRRGQGSLPPDGMPRVLKAVLCDKPYPCPKEIHDLWLEMGPGSGWSVGWERIDQVPVKRWSPEAKARVRQRNLRARMEKKFPLFADGFIAAELAARPDYFAGRGQS